MRTDISSWDLEANLAESNFTFTPPEGAQEIEMVPIN